ncbi:MAG: hypothetical protein A4E19_14740 [Nitrospira sp. SG-bin1]|nr:MAG: hypothetical protein A4E19_14740 [Nitrospira sp. SG-bin1]
MLEILMVEAQVSPILMTLSGSGVVPRILPKLLPLVTNCVFVLREILPVGSVVLGVAREVAVLIT